MNMFPIPPPWPRARTTLHQTPRARTPGPLFLFLVGLASFLLESPAGAVPMTNDPKGFEGIPWGATFSETATFVKVEESGRFQMYELKSGAPPLGGTPVDSMRFTTVDGKFARVTIRYHGQAEHDRIMAYLESQYGPLDRTPGQIAAGAVQLYSWSGPTTEVTLRYRRRENQGIIFFESQSLRSSFTEGASATAQ